MAFADALRPSSAGTVVLRADTGQFNAQIEAAERRWRESVGQMSREALKLDLAQDRLRKSLAQYGAESAQAKRATIALRDAEEAAARAADRQTREMRELDRAQGRARLSAHGLIGTVVGLSAAYVGIGGLVSAARSAIEAASNLQEQQNKTSVVFGASARAVLDWSRTTASSIGIAADQALEAAGVFGNMLVPMGIARERAAEMSRAMVQLAADMASFNNADPSEVLLALRSGLAGESEPLRRFGVFLNEARVASEAMRLGLAASKKEITDSDKALARYSLILRDTRDAQGDFARTSDSLANAQRGLRAQWREMQFLVGGALLPAVTGLTRSLRDYLGDAENQRRVQRQVNEAVETGEQVVRGFASAFRTVRTVLRPVVDLLGGTEEAVRTLLLALAIGKVLSFAAAIRSIGTSALFSRRQLGLLAATSAVGAGGPLVAPSTSPLPNRAPLPNRPPRPDLLTVLAGSILLGGALQGRGLAETQLAVAELAAVDREAAMRLARREADRLGVNVEQLAGPGNPYFRQRGVRPLAGAPASSGSFAAPDTFDPRRPGTLARPPAHAGSGAGQTGAGAPGSPTRSDLELALARAQTTRSSADDVAALQALRAFYARQIRSLEARKRLSEAQKEELRALYGDLANVQSQLDAIAEEGERKLEEQRRLAEERERRRMERIRGAAARAAERRRQLLEDVPGTRRQLRRAALRGVDETLRRLRGEAGEARGLTEADFRRLSFELLGGLRGVLAQFGSNIAGQTETNTWTTAQLMRQLDRNVATLVKGSWHPAARYAQAELGAAGWGVGF